MPRSWDVLFLGGASGTGKSRLAYALAAHLGAHVVEADDIFQAVKAMTTPASHPAIHHWSSGLNWLEVGVAANVRWLADVSRELLPALRAVAENHVESGVPVIIEGDFICPESAPDSPRTLTLFVSEVCREQLVQNYMAREGGQPQLVRAEVSVAYNRWLWDRCRDLDLPVIEARPWSTVLERAMNALSLSV